MSPVCIGIRENPAWATWTLSPWDSETHSGFKLWGQERSEESYEEESGGQTRQAAGGRQRCIGGDWMPLGLFVGLHG